MGPVNHEQYGAKQAVFHLDSVADRLLTCQTWDFAITETTSLVYQIARTYFYYFDCIFFN